MSFRSFLHRAGKSAARRAGFLLVTAVVLSGCGKDTQMSAVQAVAAGVPSLAPFFDERAALGRDAAVRAPQAPGGLQAGDTPGLYGGSRRPTVCDVERLKQFLTDPGNESKAKVWAQVLKITTAKIPDYLDGLTPVLLRHDTLVQNHDYKKGRAAPFDSVLQAGIAVLVDTQGQPAVKCSCGNPLRPFKGDTTRISVTFGDGNRKWAGYRRASVVAVTPAPRRLTRLALVDVDDPDRGMSRPVGTSGGHDSPFDTRVRRTVPDVTGMRYAEAARLLAERGLAVAGGGRTPPGGATVTGSDPAPGAELAFGRYVTLTVQAGTTDGAGGSTRGGATGSTGGEGASGRPGTTPPGPSDDGTAPSPPASSGSSAPPASGGGTPGGSSSRPSGTGTGTPPDASGSARPTGSPTSASRPPASPPATTEPPAGKPATGQPTAGKPATSQPATGKPATSQPATGKPATSRPPVTRDPVTGPPTSGAPPAGTAPRTTTPSTATSQTART